MPVPSPLVSVSVNAPTKIARIVSSRRVFDRNVFETAVPMRSRVFMRPPAQSLRRSAHPG
ncbi:hypothetical protein ACFPRL_28645 [Pseudoclavibacter helvolus]